MLGGTLVPDQIVVFIDNPDIDYTDDRVTIVRSTDSFLPKIRFALGTYFDTDYCFFIDDDLSVRTRTLENLTQHAVKYPSAILGFEGSLLNRETANPYTDDRCVNRSFGVKQVDVLIRTYFAPTSKLIYGLQLQHLNRELPKKSLDDVYLCLGNKFLGGGENIAIPVDQQNDLIELDEGGVRQSGSGHHYNNRNIVCRYLLETYE